MDDGRIVPCLIAFAAGLMLVTLAAGCEIDPSPTTPDSVEAPPGLALAVTAYGDSGPAPRVVWIQGEPACHMTAWMRDGRCVGGMFDADRSGQIYVATWPGALLSQTAAAAEALHWSRFRRGSPDWGAHDSAYYNLVARANELLWRAGF